MLNIREYGIIFQKNNDCGIAKVTVFNDTTGMYISETNTESATPVYRYIDLYQPAGAGASSEAEKKWTYWITLTEGDSYTITCVNNGTYNPYAIAPYNVSIYGFLQTDPLIVSDIVENQLVLSHSEFIGANYTFTLINEESIETYKEQQYNGNAVIKVFTLSGTNHAQEFYKFSSDGGTTWRYLNDPYITWGSNAPDYDDGLMDSNYQFSINFLDAPDSGVNNIKIKFLPLTDTAYFSLTTKQPHDLGTYKDYKPHVVINDYGIEFIS